MTHRRAHQRTPSIRAREHQRDQRAVRDGPPPRAAPPEPDAGRPACRDCGGRQELGSATVWVLAVGLVFAVLASAVAVVGASLVAGHRAQSAADLAALGGALLALDGEQAACARAAEIASLNGARLESCRLDGLDVIVTVTVATGLAGKADAVRASARAGPVEPGLEETPEEAGP